MIPAMKTANSPSRFPSFHVRVTSQDVAIKHQNLYAQESNGWHILWYGLPREFALSLPSRVQDKSLETELHARLEHQFFAILIHIETKETVLINDKFGTHQLFYYRRGDHLEIASDITLLSIYGEGKLEINTFGFNELLTFYTIRPPRTIFRDVFAVGLGSFTEIGRGKEIRTTRYWDIESHLNNKASSYDELVRSVRAALLSSIEKDSTPSTSVALSGGLDSAGILGMMHSVTNRSIDAISLGPHGPSSSDLVRARQSAEHSNARYHEIHPSFESLYNLPEYLGGLSQPLLDIAYPYSLIFDEAKRMGHDKVALGFGINILLGTLKIARASYILSPLERILPQSISKKILSAFGHAKGLSDNKRRFLEASSWQERYFYNAGPLYSREKHIYSGFPETFEDQILKELSETLTRENLDHIDRFPLTYALFWSNYSQNRDIRTLGRSLGVDLILPFNTPEVAQQLFRITTSMRRKNKWRKQLVRDAFRPYIHENLYQNVAKSLLIPYSKWFGEGRHKPVLEYVRSSPLLKAHIDFDTYEHEYTSLPEPGLHLFRLMNIAVWYDCHFERGRLEMYKEAIASLIEMRDSEDTKM